jgi:hypothetical protein
MLDGRKTLLLLCVVALTGLPGCLMGAIGASSTAYVGSSRATTEGLTDLSNSAGAEKCEAAVTEWLVRGELPLPVLESGTASFAIRGSRRAKVNGVKGAQIVELWDRGSLVAEYVVVWERSPEQYRLYQATNRRYDKPLEVKGVAILKRAELS